MSAQTMTVKELRAAVKAARADINKNYKKIESAIKNRHLPKYARSTYFYQTYETLVDDRKSFLRSPISKMRKKDLETTLKKVEKFRDTPTGTVVGIKNRIEEEKNTARSVLIKNGFSRSEVENLNIMRLSEIFRFGDLLKELYGYGDSEKLRVAREIKWESGETYARLYRAYKRRPPEDPQDWESALHPER